jgi:predicted RNA-binding protein with PIN domain
MTVWLVDGNNVMGSRPDRWWNDRPAAQARLTQQIAEWCRQHRDDVVLVFDGRPVEAVAMLAGGNLRIEFASRQGRNAADDRLVELAIDHETSCVVTADRGLIARLPASSDVRGPRSFLATITRP